MECDGSDIVHQDIDAAELADRLVDDRMVMSRGTITEILNTLERRGLVRRSADAADRRMRSVMVTPEGRARLKALRPELHRAEKRLVQALSEAEQQQMLELVAALQAELSQE
jgi:DNA-binding MarR family transcriptional regulator